MRSLEEIRRTPVGLLSEEEINLLSPADQAFASTALTMKHSSGEAVSRDG
jgi:hypothetical protein